MKITDRFDDQLLNKDVEQLNTSLPGKSVTFPFSTNIAITSSVGLNKPTILSTAL